MQAEKFLEKRHKRAHEKKERDNGE